ncbi:NACHT domain-containing protein [candidate division KSB1 bacterium]|nr:SUMF1/EgtB/PvdO family nonheme iron enzyme [candidate division KSB1 bacterium]RQW01778.1 MAG: NACHT domain-containing protein [candidate division KSB1 bacterium]
MRKIIRLCVLLLTLQSVAAFSFLQQDSISVDTAAVDTQIIAEQKTSSRSSFAWDKHMPWIIAFLAVLFAVYQYVKRRRDKKDEAYDQQQGIARFHREQEQDRLESDEDRYIDFLRETLGKIGILGASKIDALQVKLLESFVSLDLSETSRTEDKYERDFPEMQRSDNLSPELVMRRAFAKHRMLLIIGDPGSGKTTLLKYYAISIIEGKLDHLISVQRPLPIYVPLREINFSEQDPNLCEALEKWTNPPTFKITQETFARWMNEKDVLILLDGLDEIPEEHIRRRACKWIDKTAEGIAKAHFIITSRWTGIDAEKNIKITFPHLRADVCDFSDEQKSQFLKQWYTASLTNQLPPPGQDEKTWLLNQREKAQRLAGSVITYLSQPHNTNLSELARSPMILQIIALLWKEKSFKAQSRSTLYSAALHYLLEERDVEKDIPVFMHAIDAINVLKPAAMWMQETIATDDVDMQTMHNFLQDLLDAYDKNAKDFCDFLCKRAGLFIAYGKRSYIFRHKSFREYLVGERIAALWQDKVRMKQIARFFGAEWWKEPFRFYFNAADSERFNAFMEAFFASTKKELDQKEQNFLIELIKESPAKPVSALQKKLFDNRLAPQRKRYILECLKAIGSKEAMAVLQEFAEKTTEPDVVKQAQDILAEQAAATVAAEPLVDVGVSQGRDIFQLLPASFRNRHELNAEYLRIPGGSYVFSQYKKEVDVPDLYVATYPVTNKRYRRFVAFLKEELQEESLVPLPHFAQELTAFAATVKGFSDYLPSRLDEWASKMAIKYDNKKFLEDDQPVMCITWYDAVAYCVWLTLIQAAGQRGNNTPGLAEAATFYRLPHEYEWEWAAAGREADGSLRDYPWPKEKKDPTPKLANYAGNVGATTPVGRYPEGATPEGVMDMAGNVWEWQANWSSTTEKYRALRGGSWFADPGYLRCSARGSWLPDYEGNIGGFRVVRAQSPFSEVLNF